MKISKIKTAAPVSETEALLALAVPAASPAKAVKARLLARIKAAEGAKVVTPTAAKLNTVSKAKAATRPVAPGWRFESASEAEGWRATFPGVRFKTLSVDDARDVVMLLVEMAPGARFPDHPHDESGDEGVVIAGDVTMDGRELRAGDYYHADVGTNHVNITSRGGCTALLSLRASAWRKWRERLVTR